LSFNVFNLSEAAAPNKSPRPTQKKFQFYNRPTVHARFQSVSPQQTPSKPTARHHVAAEQEAQDFRPRRPALTLLTPYHYPEHIRNLPKPPHAQIAQ
jgi:hypothetical protein